MHPVFGDPPTEIRQLVDYMRTKPDVRFTTMAEATNRFLARAGHFIGCPP